VLEEKGHVSHEEEGLRYVYRPLVSRNSARKSALRHVVETFFDGSAEKAVAALLGGEASRLNEEELERIADLIAKDQEGRPAMNSRLITLGDSARRNVYVRAVCAAFLEALRIESSINPAQALPAVTVIANDRTRGSRHEVSTDRNGRFELSGLVEGSYVLEADLPGFETFS
jgi:hypothetical protein